MFVDVVVLCVLMFTPATTPHGTRRVRLGDTIYPNSVRSLVLESSIFGIRWVMVFPIDLSSRHLPLYYMVLTGVEARKHSSCHPTVDPHQVDHKLGTQVSSLLC